MDYPGGGGAIDGRERNGSSTAYPKTGYKEFSGVSAENIINYIMSGGASPAFWLRAVCASGPCRRGVEAFQSKTIAQKELNRVKPLIFILGNYPLKARIKKIAGSVLI